MKSEPKFNIKLPTRIIISALLLLVQFGFLFISLYDIAWHSTGLYVLSMFLGIITVISIINRRSNPDHKIAWIVFILLFPVFGSSKLFLWFIFQRLDTLFANLFGDLVHIGGYLVTIVVYYLLYSRCKVV